MMETNSFRTILVLQHVAWHCVESQESADSTSVDAGIRASIVAVGDSLPHDVQGAIRADIASIFVAGGVHSRELGVEQGGGGIPSDEAYSAAFSKHLEGDGAPTHVVPAFRW